MNESGPLLPPYSLDDQGTTVCCYFRCLVFPVYILSSKLLLTKDQNVDYVCFFVVVCGGTYFTSKGALQSPNYPNIYPNNKDCTWTISVPNGQQIKLNVTDFSMEGYSRSCLYDYLEIRCVSLRWWKHPS